jgi:hypothetical protein
LSWEQVLNTPVSGWVVTRVDRRHVAARQVEPGQHERLGAHGEVEAALRYVA